MPLRRRRHHRPGAADRASNRPMRNGIRGGPVNPEPFPHNWRQPAEDRQPHRRGRRRERPVGNGIPGHRIVDDVRARRAAAPAPGVSPC